MSQHDVQSTDALVSGCSRRQSSTDDQSRYDAERNVYLKYCDPYLREHLVRWYGSLPKTAPEPIQNSKLLTEMFSLAGFPITAILLLDGEGVSLLPTYLRGDVPEEFRVPICCKARMAGGSFSERAFNTPGEPIVGTRRLEDNTDRTCIGSAITDHRVPFGIVYVEELVTTGPRRNMLLTFKALLHALHTGLHLAP